MIVEYIVKILAMMILMYLVWRNNRDNLNEGVVSFGWFILLSFLIGGRVIWSIFNLTRWNNNFLDWVLFWDNPGINFLAGLGAVLGFVFVYSLYDRLNWTEIGEDIVTPLIIFGCLWLVSDWQKFLGGDFWEAGGLVLVGLMSTWARKYRSFYWYKSGKKGFLLLFSAGLYCLYLFGVNIFTKDGDIFTYLALVMGLLFWIYLVILGEVVRLDFKKK